MIIILNWSTDLLKTCSLLLSEWEKGRGREKLREGNGGKKQYMCFTKKMAFKNGSVVSVGWLLFPGASGKRGKAYSSTRASGNKLSPSVCFLSHHGQCLFHLLVYILQDDRETQLIKHDHKALGKITASTKRTHANMERPAVCCVHGACVHGMTEWLRC